MHIDLKEYISSLYGNISSISPLSGGDVSSVYKVTSTNGDFVAKTGSVKQHYALLEAEMKGLTLLSTQNAIATPEVHKLITLNNTACLLMDFIPAKTPISSDMEKFGYQLAELHTNTSDTFGAATDNFIANLPQSNTLCNNWVEFFINERLFPQFNIALQNGLLNQNDIPEKAKMFNILSPIVQTVKPSVLHGDLWSGNYLIHENGTPYLIDPSAYYGHSMVDIAMTKLFGGFSPSFYQAYHSMIKPDSNAQQLTEIYQLYYLLVHLNLFGSGYKNSVLKIIQQFF